MIAMTLLVFLSAAPAAQAAPALTFEQALGQIRLQVMETRQAQAVKKKEVLAGDISRLSMDLANYRWDVSRMRTRVSDIRRRAQTYNPAKPDPFFRSALQRVVWDMRDIARKLDWTLNDAQRIRREAVKDPNLVAPAQDLAWRTQDMLSEVGWVENDVRWAVWDIRRAGFSMEAWDLERESGDMARDARDLDTEAREILNKVR